MARRPPRDYLRTALYLPRDVKARIIALANARERSLNEQLLWMLRCQLEADVTNPR
jgi:hypothetical protein